MLHSRSVFYLCKFMIVFLFLCVRCVVNVLSALLSFLLKIEEKYLPLETTKWVSWGLVIKHSRCHAPCKYVDLWHHFYVCVHLWREQIGCYPPRVLKDSAVLISFNSLICCLYFSSRHYPPLISSLATLFLLNMSLVVEGIKLLLI